MVYILYAARIAKNHFLTRIGQLLSIHIQLSKFII
jgi:hypothetical protein